MSDNCKFQNELTRFVSLGIFNKIDENIIKNYIASIIQSGEPIDLDCLLIEASYKGSLDLIQYLIKCGANVEAESISGSTPVMFLSQRDHIEGVRFCVELGANLFKSNSNRDVLSYTKQNSECYNYITAERNRVMNNSRQLSQDNEDLKKKYAELESKMNYLLSNIGMLDLDPERNRKLPKRELGLENI